VQSRNSSGKVEVADELIGRVIAGKLRIETLVGAGAMGSVYRAQHLALKKAVAIKVMKVHGATDRKYAQRFKREAKAASRLDHPNTIRLLDFGQEPDGLLYIAMELIEGRSLAQVILEEWPLPAERIVGILSQALAGLAKAHEIAIIHRDLKPENILLVKETDDEGQAVEIAKVCDFGVAKFVEDGPPDEIPPPMATHSSTQTTLTLHGMTVGTPAYMSPEQALGDRTDVRSDIYQMGVLLFQLLTRRVPFEAATAIKVMLKQIEEPPPLPSTLVEGIDPRLEAICLKALRKKPGQRHQSAREMRAELRAIVDPVSLKPTEPVRSAAPPPPPAQRTVETRATSSHLVRFAAIALVTFALLVSVALLLLRR
jgi:serine/threonine-protein kinase